jgi:hypothetical protein
VIEKGWLGAEGGGPGRVWWLELDRATVKRLRAVKARGTARGAVLGDPS